MVRGALACCRVRGEHRGGLLVLTKNVWIRIRVISINETLGAGVRGRAPLGAGVRGRARGS